MDELRMYNSPLSDQNAGDSTDEDENNHVTRMHVNGDTSPARGGGLVSRFVGSMRPSSSSSSATSHIGASSSSGQQSTVRAFADRCRYVPLRLTEEERRLLTVLENALNVCEYTDVVDVTFSHTRKSKQARIVESLVDVLSISCGLLMANNLTKGEGAIAGKTLTDNVPLFAQIFEIGRRYKIMNPSKMRDTYGKLMFALMDTESYHIKNELKLNFVRPIQTVGVFLEDKGAPELLTDPLLFHATRSVDDAVGDKSKTDLASESQAKAAAAKELVQRYASPTLTEADIQRILDSISDNEAYLTFNVQPVDRAIQLLTTHFHPKKVPENESHSLELMSRPRKTFSSFSFSGFSSRYTGGGACLSHDHATQFTFVLQSLTLWREIMWHMPKLWQLADRDMLGEQYRLADTGQGYHRLQSCPHVGAEMRRILSSVQQRCGGAWVGLSVIHLGDRDVPNALVFIDKYTQVPRILAPIVKCVDRLPSLVQNTAFHKYVSDEWGSIDGLRMQVLSDFFKHGFDGSGDDGGSCIDGRLTSAWNWCSKLHKKPYYHVFMFTGFQGFDGDWKQD